MPLEMGTLGRQEEPGKFVDNDIPGAKDESEAYDLRRYRLGCAVGTGHKSPPRGIVSFYEWDDSSYTETIEYGELTVVTEGARTCVILPKVQVGRTSGKLTTYRWFDWCCSLVFEGDCMTALEFIEEQSTTREHRRVLKPDRVCVTDWGDWILDKLGGLLEKGLTLENAVKALGLLAQAEPTGRTDAALALASGIDPALKPRPLYAAARSINATPLKPGRRD